MCKTLERCVCVYACMCMYIFVYARIHTVACILQVQESWERIEQNLDSLGVKFFMRFFALSPSALQLFSFKGACTISNPFDCLVYVQRNLAPCIF
jgi:hypothetical protein